MLPTSFLDNFHPLSMRCSLNLQLRSAHEKPQQPNRADSPIDATKDKIGHKSGGSEIFTSFCYKSRVFWGFFPVQNTNFHEGVHSISNIGPYHVKKFIKKSKF